MKEELKAKASTYTIGGIGGAVVVLIAGFWFGPLTTNRAVADAVDKAVVEQQALFCAERGRADPAYIDAATFKARAFAEKRDFAAPFAEFNGQTSGRAVARACRAILERELT